MMTLLVQTAAVPFGFTCSMSDFGDTCPSRTRMNCAEMDSDNTYVVFPLPDVVTSNRPSLPSLRSDNGSSMVHSTSQALLEHQNNEGNSLDSRSRPEVSNPLHRCSSVRCGIEDAFTSPSFRGYVYEFTNLKEVIAKTSAKGRSQICERGRKVLNQRCSNEYDSQRKQSHPYSFEFISYETTHVISTCRRVGVDLLSIADQFERNYAKAKSKNANPPATTLKIPQNFIKYIAMSFACLLVWRQVNKYR
ncbi:uncharacterized protein LOC135221517 [Macrobrachium nipponense]|uniref:uncharacterized protein LOC135221517 n=1 Tax=Macrobrachium nipponense TaxID=159736 RepID=UPI0030C8B1D9